MAVLPILLASNAPDFSEAALKNDGRKIISRKFEFKIKKKKKRCLQLQFYGEDWGGERELHFCKPADGETQEFLLSQKCGNVFPSAPEVPSLGPMGPL